MTWNPIWPPPQGPKIKTKYDRGIIELKKVILVPNSMFFHNFGMIYSLVHLKNAHIVHMNWNPLWPPPKMAKMTNKGNFGIIEPRKLIFVCNSMFMSVIYSRVHLKCTQNSHDLKSNMATIETPKMLSLINWYSSQKILPQIKRKAKCDGWGNEMCCKNTNKAVAWSMTRIAPFGQALCRLSVWSSMVWWYHPIICLS